MTERAFTAHQSIKALLRVLETKAPHYSASRLEARGALIRTKLLHCRGIAVAAATSTCLCCAAGELADAGQQAQHYCVNVPNEHMFAYVAAVN